MKANKKTIWATFIGIPNAGKSTLLNSIVGSKISIVTHKAQTTRTSLKGIITEGDTQIVLIDTPGIFQARGSRLGRLMVDCAWNSLSDVDEVFLIVDCTKARKEENLNILKALKKKEVRCNLVLNKIDLIKKEKLLNIARELNEVVNFQNTFMISAEKKQGLDKILEFFHKEAKTPGWFFDEDEMTSAPLRFMASETIREKLFLYTHDELPYNLDVEIEAWDEKDNLTVISAVIFVKGNGHKGIVIGHRGELLKKIGTQAREDLEKLIEKKIYLNIHVKVSDWDNKLVSRGLKQF